MNKKLVIIDYGVGNIRSLVHAFKYLGEKVEITSDIKKIKNSSHIILPGVGSFGYAINQLKKLDIFNTITIDDSVYDLKVISFQNLQEHIIPALCSFLDEIEHHKYYFFLMLLGFFFHQNQYNYI